MKKQNIQYILNDKNIRQKDFSDFFNGWTKKPDGEKFIRALKRSHCYFIARHENKVIGFINAISDGELTAYIPLLEVLPEYQGHGVGTKLSKLLIEHLNDFYMIDILCDQEIQPFYERLGLHKAHAMCMRNYNKI